MDVNTDEIMGKEVFNQRVYSKKNTDPEMGMHGQFERNRLYVRDNKIS